MVAVIRTPNILIICCELLRYKIANWILLIRDLADFTLFLSHGQGHRCHFGNITCISKVIGFRCQLQINVAAPLAFAEILHDPHSFRRHHALSPAGDNPSVHDRLVVVAPAAVLISIYMTTKIIDKREDDKKKRRRI